MAYLKYYITKEIYIPYKGKSEKFIEQLGKMLDNCADGETFMLTTIPQGMALLKFCDNRICQIWGIDDIYQNRKLIEWLQLRHIPKFVKEERKEE